MGFIPAATSTAKYWAPALLSLVSGRFGAGAEAGRMSKLRKQLEQLFSTESIGGETNRLFDLFKGSPMYSGLRSQAMTGATSLANRLNTSFYRRGLGTSGIAAVAEPLARSSYQQTFANIDADMFREALQTALANLRSRAGILQGTQAPSIGAGTFGAGIQSYLPYLYAMLLRQRGGQLTPGYGAAGGAPGLPGETPFG